MVALLVLNNGAYWDRSPATRAFMKSDSSIDYKLKLTSSPR